MVLTNLLWKKVFYWYVGNNFYKFEAENYIDFLFLQILKIFKKYLFIVHNADFSLYRGHKYFYMHCSYFLRLPQKIWLNLQTFLELTIYVTPNKIWRYFIIFFFPSQNILILPKASEAGWRWLQIRFMTTRSSIISHL